MEVQEDRIDSVLEERLQKHSRAFESLLALTPAREYFGNHFVDGHDPSDQWNRKKQTKEEKRAAKKAKLDPANQKSALDIIKDRELKRKRELGLEDQEVGTGLKPDLLDSESKRQKVELGTDALEARRKATAEKRREKRHAKQEKQAKLKAKLQVKKFAKSLRDKEKSAATEHDDQEPNDATEELEDTSEIVGFDASGLIAQENNSTLEKVIEDASSVPTSPELDSPAFDIGTNHSTASSSSSIVPPSQLKETASQQPISNPRLDTTRAEQTQELSAQSISGTSSPKIQLPNIDQAQLQERLRQRIEQLRARRKADGPDGKPAKSRQELLDQRRRKEEQRKATKKELRRKQKEQEQEKQEAQLRGSGSPLSGDVFGARSPKAQDNNFSFSRLAFDDGTSATADLSGLNDLRKQKGRSDPKTALEAAQKKQARIAGLDAEKRADIAEKDLWLNAKKRAHGERVRDDTSLLKKALKRKEKQKSKSEKQWQEREDAVVRGKELKQKRRETNLQKRKEEKGQKGKKKPNVGKGTMKKKGRPGFEGRFKA